MIVGEPGEPGAVKVDCQGLVVGAESVDAHVELAAAEQQGVEQVALADVLFDRRVPSRSVPPGDIVNLVENENAFTLALRRLCIKMSVPVS